MKPNKSPKPGLIFQIYNPLNNRPELYQEVSFNVEWCNKKIYKFFKNQSKKILIKNEGEIIKKFNFKNNLN